MKAGNYKELKLKHGDSERSFSNVTVREFKPYTTIDKNTEEQVPTSETRWELSGTEHKVQWARRGGVTEIVDIPVTVGFLPENVIK